MLAAERVGYTLVEIVVALLVFTVGALALAASSAVIARSMKADALRENAGRLAASRIEILRSECGPATTGAENVGAIHSEWSATPSAGATTILESTRYGSPSGIHIESYSATAWCAP